MPTTTINGTGITFPNGTTQTTAASGAGTVTSVATGNGLSGGTITTSGTLTVACPTFNSVGSYAYVICWANGNYIYPGSNYPAGTGTFQMQTISIRASTPSQLNSDPANVIQLDPSNNLSGTWKWMGSQAYVYAYNIAIACRVS